MGPSIAWHPHVPFAPNNAQIAVAGEFSVKRLPQMRIRYRALPGFWFGSMRLQPLLRQVDLQRLQPSKM
jgi:hypothetical protein